MSLPKAMALPSTPEQAPCAQDSSLLSVQTPWTLKRVAPPPKPTAKPPQDQEKSQSHLLPPHTQGQTPERHSVATAKQRSCLTRVMLVIAGVSVHQWQHCGQRKHRAVPGCSAPKPQIPPLPTTSTPGFLSQAHQVSQQMLPGGFNLMQCTVGCLIPSTVSIISILSSFNVRE